MCDVLKFHANMRLTLTFQSLRPATQYPSYFTGGETAEKLHKLQFYVQIKLSEGTEKPKKDATLVCGLATFALAGDMGFRTDA